MSSLLNVIDQDILEYLEDHINREVAQERFTVRLLIAMTLRKYTARLEQLPLSFLLKMIVHSIKVMHTCSYTASIPPSDIKSSSTGHNYRSINDLSRQMMISTALHYLSYRACGLRLRFANRDLVDFRALCAVRGILK